MMISTKGRYALRVMIDLADQGNGSCIPLKDIARRQGISQKYLENIMTKLSKAGLVDGVHGKGGGYCLNRASKDYKVSEILRLTEGTLAPVACLDSKAQPCSRAPECRTLPFWNKLDSMISGFLDGVSLADFLAEVSGDDEAAPG